MEDNTENELTEEELSRYLGGAQKEVLAERLGISVEKYEEIMKLAATDPKLMAVLRGNDLNYIDIDGKISSDHKMGGK